MWENVFCVEEREGLFRQTVALLYASGLGIPAGSIPPPNLTSPHTYLDVGPSYPLSHRCFSLSKPYVSNGRRTSIPSH